MKSESEIRDYFNHLKREVEAYDPNACCNNPNHAREHEQGLFTMIGGMSILSWVLDEEGSKYMQAALDSMKSRNHT